MVFFEVLLLLLQVLHTGFQEQSAKCVLRDPISTDHKYYKTGELMIGGISSQMMIYLDQYSFTDYPSPNFEIP